MSDNPARNAASAAADSFADRKLRKPITGIAACCARAASGHATTVLPESLMNSRRLMASPAPRTKSGIKRLSHFWIENCAVRRTQAGPQPCPLWVKSGHRGQLKQCLLYPQKRTLLRATGMSALCHRATYASAAIDRDLLGQVLTNFRQQFARAVGLRDISVAAGRMRFAIIAAQSVGSYGDDRNAV